MRRFPSILTITRTAALAAALPACSRDQPAPPPLREVPPSPAVTAASAGAKAPAEPPPPPGSSTIRGSIAFTGKVPDVVEIPKPTDPACATKPIHTDDLVVNPNKTLRDVLVRIAPGELHGKYPPPTAPVVLDQVDCVYAPHVAGAMSGARVEVRNGDKTLHNVHTYRGGETLFNLVQPAGAAPISKESLSSEAGVLKLKCDVHPWMTAYLVVTDHPFFQTTGPDGSFQLARVPEGSYTVEAWHPKLGAKSTKVTLAPGQTVDVKLSFSGDEKSPE